MFDDGLDGVFSLDLAKSNNGRDEILVIGDSDNDNILDSEEISEGTSPLDRLSYCFNCDVEISGVFSTTNSLSVQAMFGDVCLYGPTVETNSTLTLNFGHLVATNGERIVIYFWDDFDEDAIRDVGETYVSVMVYAQSHDVHYLCPLPHGGFDADRDGILDWWPQYYQLEDGAYDDTDGDGLINLHEFWAGSNPLAPDGSNTVLSVIARSIDDRIRGVTASDETKCIYLDYANPNMGAKLFANTNCWAYGIDFTCASPWNAPSKAKRAGTAISPRHLLFAKHFYLGGGAIYFHMSNGGVHTNSVIAVRGHQSANVDIAVGLLADDLPVGVNYAKILPQDYYLYIKTGHALPTLSFDQQEHALVCDIENIYSTVTGRMPSGDRCRFFENVISGDSGNPRFFVIGDNVILLHTFYYGGTGSGPSVRYYKDDIQQLMDDLSTAAGLEPSDYRLEEFDFGGYQPCEN